MRLRGADSVRVSAAKMLAEIARGMRRRGESFGDALRRAEELRPDLARIGRPAHDDVLTEKPRRR